MPLRLSGSWRLREVVSQVFIVWLYSMSGKGNHQHTIQHRPKNNENTTSWKKGITIQCLVYLAIGDLYVFNDAIIMNTMISTAHTYEEVSERYIQRCEEDFRKKTTLATLAQYGEVHPRPTNNSHFDYWNACTRTRKCACAVRKKIIIPVWWKTRPANPRNRKFNWCCIAWLNAPTSLSPWGWREEIVAMLAKSYHRLGFDCKILVIANWDVFRTSQWKE